MGTFILILLICGVAFFIYWRFRKNFKFLNTPSVCLVTGGVKTGKTQLVVYLSQKDYFAIHRKWRFQRFFCKILRKPFETEEPLFYTNGYITFGSSKSKKPHKLDKNIRQLPLEALLRLERFNYKSVILIQEASLLSDNMDFNNQDRNAELSLWAKLIAHETRGGKVYLDTQSIKDLSYPLKRVLSTLYFIQKRVDLWFFAVLYVRELINDEIAVNTFNDDVDTTTRKVLIWRWWYKKYDRYEFSYLTDDLKTSQRPFVRHHSLVSFNPLYRDKADKRINQVAPSNNELAAQPNKEVK